MNAFIDMVLLPLGEGCWVMQRLQLTSPAVTLELKPQNEEEDTLSVDIVPALEVPQGWPQAARAGPDIDRWLGKRCRRNFTSKAVYFVPKGPKAKNLKDEAKGGHIYPLKHFSWHARLIYLN